MNTLDCYEVDFEVALLEASAEYYKRKAATWIQVRAPRARACPTRAPAPAGSPRAACQDWVGERSAFRV